jgi:hypothetical protein
MSMTKKKAIDTLVRRVGHLTCRIEQNKDAVVDRTSYDKSEREAILTILLALERAEAREYENEVEIEDNYGNIEETREGNRE